MMVLKPKCSVCEKEFAFQSWLIRHLKSHTGEKPHKCELCNKMFSLRDNLQQHLKAHSGEKPMKCDFCEQSFNQKYKLKKHSNVIFVRNISVIDTF